MAINKVEYGGNTLIDLTSDTVESSVLPLGRTAHKKDGTLVTGTRKWRFIVHNTLVFWDRATLNNTTLITEGTINGTTLIL